MSQQRILQPDATAGVDTYLRSNSANSNFGTVNYMYVGALFASKTNNAFRGLLRFDLRPLLGSTILDATLTLFQAGTSFVGSPTFTANRLTQQGWTELGATHNKYDGTNNWTAVGGDYTATGHDTTTGVSNQDLVFGGLLALAADAIALRGGFLDLLIIGPEVPGTTNYCVVYSSEDTTPTRRPKLVVNYNPPPPILPNFSGGMQELTGNLGA